MNCNQFLEALESDEDRQRDAARAHALTCESCGALADVHERLKAELGAYAPLPERLREVWAAVVEVSPVSPRSGREHVPNLPHPGSSAMGLVALAAALLLLITVGLLIGNRPPEVVQPIPPSAPVSLAKTIDASEELADLLVQVKGLEAKLQTTTQQAELVDARREANVLLATYSQW